MGKRHTRLHIFYQTLKLVLNRIRFPVTSADCAPELFLEPFEVTPGVMRVAMCLYEYNVPSYRATEPTNLSNLVIDGGFYDFPITCRQTDHFIYIPCISLQLNQTMSV